MAPPTADPEGHDDFTDSYIKSRRRWLAIGLGGVIPGLLAAGVGILWNEHQIWFRAWSGGMLFCNLVLLGLLLFLRKALSPTSSSMHKAQTLRYCLLGLLALIILVAPATLAYFTYSKGIILDVEGAYVWVPWMCSAPQLIPVGLAIVISFQLWNVRSALMGKGPAGGGHLLQPLAGRRSSTRRPTSRPSTARPHSSSGNGRRDDPAFSPSDDSALDDHDSSSRQPRRDAYASGSETDPDIILPHQPVHRTASAHLGPSSKPTAHDFAYGPRNSAQSRTRSFSMSKKHRSYSSSEESD